MRIPSAVAAAAFALALFGGASTARATYEGPLPIYLGVGLGVGVPALTIAAVFFGETIDDAIHRGHGIAEEAAIFEVVWASALLTTATIMGAFAASSAASCIGLCEVTSIYASIAIPAFLLGTGHLIESIWSLTAGHEPLAIQPSLSPIEGGALGTLSGVF